VLQTAVTNLLLRSEELDNASWASVNTNVTANAIAAPNGTVTADLITSNTATSNSKRRQQSTTIIASTLYTLTCYLKLANSSVPHAGLSLTSNADASTYVTARWNLSTGVNTLGTANGGFTFTSQSITSIGDDWYRCSVTGIISSATDMTIVIYGSPSGTSIGSGLRGAQSFTTALGDNIIYAWGAQLEQSSTVGEYIPTTSTINSAPRFDHNPATGESLGLLVEEQRTNLLTYSEDISQWATPTNATQTLNDTIAPDGATTADKLLETAVTGLHTNDGPAFTFVTSTVYTYSVFVKPIGDRNFEIAFPATVFTARFARFTLSGAGSVQGTDSGVTGSIQAYANGWYRCVATSTCASGAGSRVGNFINNASNARSYLGDTSKGIYVWGAQLEAGAFPTSYIPTTTATVTRSADVCSISGSNFSSWYRQDEGTIYAEGGPSVSTINKTQLLATVNDNSSNNRWYVGKKFDSTTVAEFGVASGGAGQAFILSTPSSIVNAKYAAAYRVDSFGFIASGGALGVDTSGIVPSGIDRLLIGTLDSASNNINGTIRRLTFWPTRLSNSTLQAVTQ
jgi:hypothetical protein